MKINYLLLFAGFISLFSCQKNITDIDIPYNEQLVLRGFITPQDTLTEIQVSRTTPIIGVINPDYRIEPNAILTISDGQKTTTIKFQTFRLKNPNYVAGSTNSGNNNIIDNYSDSLSYFGYYIRSKDFQIVAGKSYTIRASTKDGLAAEATCTVPILKLVAKDIEIVTGTTVRRNRTEPTYQAKWPDIGNEPNYYAVSVKNQLYSTTKDAQGREVQNITTYTVGTGYYNDVLLNGQVISSERFAKRDRTGGNRGQAQVTTVTAEYVDVEVYQTDKFYYDFNKSLTQQQAIDGNPFAEPVVIQSNVKGGLGGFGGANRVTLRIKL